MVHHRVPITIRLESFEGPLDLLLYLIQTHDLDISKVSLSKITDQFVAYVRLLQELNFDFASDFLVMAATLVQWKSKAILPNENQDQLAAGEEEEQGMSQEDLLRQLLEHQRFLAAGDDLAQMPRLWEDVFVRPNAKPPTHRIWREMNATDLALSYQDSLTRARKRKQILRKETVSLTEKIMEFGRRLEMGKMTEFAELITLTGDRPETVVTFLASLELSRLKRMRMHQEQTYGPIYLELIETLRGFDMTLASGFDLPPSANLITSVEAAAKAAEIANLSDAEQVQLAAVPPDAAPEGAHL
ncbi:MAG: ScpA family protein [Bacteriovoracia bacterium]